MMKSSDISAWFIGRSSNDSSGLMNALERGQKALKNWKYKTESANYQTKPRKLWRFTAQTEPDKNENQRIMMKDFY